MLNIENKRSQLRRWSLTLVLLLAFSLTHIGFSSASEPLDQCSLPTDLVAPILEIEPVTSDCAPQDPCSQKLILKAQALAEEYPDSVLVQRAYQNRVLGQMDGQGELIDRYRRRLDQRPKDAASHYLFARLNQTDPDLSREELLRTVELDPRLPWGHLGLAVSYWRMAGRSFGATAEEEPQSIERDRELARQHMDRFMELCPDRFEEPLLNAQALFGVDYWRSHVSRLRSALGQASEKSRVAYSSYLWTLEFKVTPFGEHEAVRDRVAADLKAIAAMDLKNSPTWWNILEQGYRLTGDSQGLDRLRAEKEEADPCSDSVASSRMGRTMSIPEDPEERHTLFEEVANWSKQCPENFLYCASTFELSRTIELSDDERLAIIDRYLDCWEDNQNVMTTSEAPNVKAARELLDRNLQPERALRLIEEGIADAEAAGEKPMPAGMPDEFRTMMISTNLIHEISRFNLLARANLVLDDSAAAIDALELAGQSLVEFKLIEPELNPRLQHSISIIKGKYERLRGEAAEADDRPLDAVGHYLAASRLEGETGDSFEKARRVWSTTGGSPATFDLVAAAGDGPEQASIEEFSPWTEQHRELPAFELTDLNGKKWTPEQLSDTITVINLWATWCGPCRLELPFLQKVHEALADRDDAQVLTLNSDFNLGLIAPFIEKNGYTFPVCPAQDYLNSTLGGIALPQTWIVDGSGTLRYKQGGFSPELGEEWVTEVINTVDRLAGNAIDPSK